MPVNEYGFTHRREPFKHQARILKDTWNLPYWALFCEMGTGKSAIIIETAAALYLTDKIDAMVIVAKKGEYANWPEKLLPDHMPVEVPYEVFTFDTDKWNTVASREARKKFIAKEPRRLHVFVINVESVDTESGDKALKAFYAAFPGRVFWVGDETTWLKNVKNESTRGKAARKDKRAKAMLKLRDKSPYRRIMAGLPNPQSPGDMWGQALMLKPGLLGFDDWWSFRNYYAIVEKKWVGAGQSFDKIVGWHEDRLKELQHKVRTFASVVPLDECVDIPEAIYDKRAVLMTPEQETLYEDMRKTAMATLEDGLRPGNDGSTQVIVEATNALAQMSRLHQIVCGQMKISEDHYVSIPNNRLLALGDLLEDHPGKGIVWAGYRQTGEDAHKHLVKMFGPDAVARYYGGTEADERRGVIRNFQDADNPRFIVASRSMAYSFTLTAADLNVYYSNTFNLEHRLQSEKRTRRIGQSKHVRYVDLYVPNTIDERIMNVLREKKNLSHEVLGTPLTKWI